MGLRDLSPCSPKEDKMFNRICEVCGEVFDVHEIEELDGKILCIDCFNEEVE